MSIYTGVVIYCYGIEGQFPQITFKGEASPRPSAPISLWVIMPASVLRSPKLTNYKWAQVCCAIWEGQWIKFVSNLIPVTQKES